MKNLLCLALLLISLNCLTDWESWNAQVAANGNVGLTNYTVPPPPSYTTNAGIPVLFKRNRDYLYSGVANGYDQTLSGYTNYTIRSRQYMWWVQISPTCQIYCGPNSYLVKVNNTLLCQRDQYYWAAYTGYSKYCIPDSIATGMCIGISLGLQGICSSLTYINTPYYNIDCCYNNFNTNTQPLTDLTNKFVTTTYRNLFRSEHY